MTRMAAARHGLLLGGVAIATVLLSAGLIGRAPDVRTVRMLDLCDPESFNEAFGAGTCVFDHPGVSLGTFISVLERAQTMGAWHFAPGDVRLQSGQAVEAYNAGGEVHTFTEVAEFGGGFIPDLNDLTGNPVPAPECLDFGSIVFIPPGETGPAETKAPGTYRYECCIHPWMRATVTVR